MRTSTPACLARSARTLLSSSSSSSPPTSPALSQRLPNTQIASYLGITPEFLSKIRKDISQRPAQP